MSDPIVTVTPTIQDGAVVRWYASESAVEYGREKLSASRNGVIVYGYLHEVPQPWLDAARTAYEQLSLNGRADMKHLATHTNHWRDGLQKIDRRPTE